MHKSVILIFALFCLQGCASEKLDDKAAAEKVKEMFYHAYNNYLDHGFPKDELMPLSCKGHDTLGGYQLTLFDALDSLVVFNNLTEFQRVVNWMDENVNFDIDRSVSVFETNIRVLGSLISNHLLASDTLLNVMPEYNGCLLRLAKDLGDRLLRAYDSPTGLPYGTVNLRKGVPKGETTVSATATGGTVLLEFGLLSELTGDSKYMDAARKATNALWNKRSSLDLLGSHIDIETGEWKHLDSGISGGTDSFFEYLKKAQILFKDKEFGSIFRKGYNAIKKHVKQGPWYPDVNMETGKPMFPYYRSLQSFWPGLQALHGDYDSAIETFDAFAKVWDNFGFVPEAYDIQEGKPAPSLGQYPLRPELGESAFYLFLATNEHKYRDVGRKMIESLDKHARVDCGFAAVENVTTKELRDHMDSYFLAETVKYLYLLFDESEWTQGFRDPKRYIFNTEAHLIPLSAVKSSGSWFGDVSGSSWLVTLAIVGGFGSLFYRAANAPVNARVQARNNRKRK